MTYLEIIEAVERALKQTSSSKRDLIKIIINQVYLNEVIVVDDLNPLFWLRRLIDSKKAVGSTTITGITQADPGVVTAASHDLVSGDIFNIYSALGMTEANNRTYKVGSAAQGYTANALPMLDLEGNLVDTSGFTAYTSGGKVIHRGVELPATTEKIISFNWHDESRDALVFATPEELERDTTWWSDSTGRPKKYFLNKLFDKTATIVNQLLWFSGSDSEYDARIWTERTVDPMSADTDVPEIPVKFHNTIVSGAITRLAESNVQVENQVVWPTLYTNELAALRTYNQRYYSQDQVKRKEPPYLL